MKLPRLIFLILLIAISISSKAQNYSISKFDINTINNNSVNINYIVDSIITKDGDGQLFKKYLYNFNNDGKVANEINAEWGGEWIDVYKGTYSYNTEGKVDNYLYEENKYGTWRNNYFISYKYDIQGKITESILQNWLTDNGLDFFWQNSYRASFSYNNEKLVSQLDENWNRDLASWENYNLTTISYNSDGNKTHELRQLWEIDHWTDVQQISYEYDSFGNNTSEIRSIWVVNKWNYESRYSFFYSNENKLVTLISELWDGNNWHLKDSTNFNYDLSGNLKSYISKKQFGENWVGSVGSISFKDNIGNKYFALGAEIYIYYNQITDLHEDKIIHNKFSLEQNFPNPFNPNTNIKYQLQKDDFVNIKVYDLLGKEIITLVNQKQATGSYEIEFDASKLTSGIYFYSLTSGNLIKTKKMILLK